MKLKKSERKLLEKRKDKIIDCINAFSVLDCYDPHNVDSEGAKFLLPSARYLSKVVDSLIERRLDFVNKDGSEIGGVANDEEIGEIPPSPESESAVDEDAPQETVSNDGVTCTAEPIVTEGNLVVG